MNKMIPYRYGSLRSNYGVLITHPRAEKSCLQQLLLPRVKRCLEVFHLHASACNTTNPQVTSCPSPPHQHRPPIKSFISSIKRSKIFISSPNREIGTFRDYNANIRFHHTELISPKFTMMSVV